MGAVCDWSIPSPSKPFFSLRHVQSVDKRHHPTDSLINCEMYSYLPLSYSRAPKTPPLPAFPPLLHFCPPVKRRNKLDSIRIPFEKKKRKLLCLHISCFKIFPSFPIISTCAQPCVYMHAFTHKPERTLGGVWTQECKDTGGKRSAHDSPTGLRFKVVHLRTLFCRHMSYAFLSQWLKLWSCRQITVSFWLYI